jgi:putative tricarboxylic transport membrane protein
MVGVFVQVLRAPYSILSLVIIVSAVVGAFTAQNSLSDLWVMLVIGFVAYYLSQAEYPMAPLLLGAVLGKMLDETFRQSMALSDNGLGIFLERPITFGSIVVIAAISGFLLYKAVTGRRRQIVADE